tara:strand:+ start:12763 stop:13209 length:447 start_codon:yes stop_codon:yes gene_type:complete
MNKLEQKVEDELSQITRTICPPKGGWKPNTLYIVDVSYANTNPIHRALLFTGYTNGTEEFTFLGSNHGIWNVRGQRYAVHHVQDLRYLSFVEDIGSEVNSMMGESRLPLDVDREDAEYRILNWRCDCGALNGAEDKSCTKCHEPRQPK